MMFKKIRQNYLDLFPKFWAAGVDLVALLLLLLVISAGCESVGAVDVAEVGAAVAVAVVLPVMPLAKEFIALETC